MKTYPKTDYSILEKKAKEHKLATGFLFEEGAYDACVSAVCLSIINYMDALSVNLFGSDNKASVHSQAPILLDQKLNRVGKSNFKNMAREIHEILNLKNAASYQCQSMTKKDAKKAMDVLEKMTNYYHKNVQRLL